MKRVGFLGVGWIGRNRMQAVLETGVVEAVGIADPSAEMVVEALKLAPGAAQAPDLDGLLALGLDGVVIATPSARHAAQSVEALDRGVAVFCQKPLGRTADEVRAVVAAAEAADRLLAVDLSYRFTTAMAKVRDEAKSGGLGRVYAADLAFHNAYGPDKPWFYDLAQSGGGCVMDLGVHLVDLALWTLGFPVVTEVSADLFAGGERLAWSPDRVEDYAVVTLRLDTGAVVRVACSWRLQAGCEAVIGADFYGTQGGAAMRNVGGSFYDLAAHRFSGTARTPLAEPPDEWGGRAAADWSRRLAAGERFDPAAERLIDVAEVLDRIYGRP